jgi:hypothetical protein
MEKTTIEELEARRRVREGYREMLRHYRDKGIGERSEIAGSIIRQNLIDTIEKRFLQLGGSLRDV